MITEVLAYRIQNPSLIHKTYDYNGLPVEVYEVANSYQHSWVTTDLKLCTAMLPIDHIPENFRLVESDLHITISGTGFSMEKRK